MSDLSARIAEFLLVRIAEDEQWANGEQDRQNAAWRGEAFVPDYGTGSAYRVLAECDAKRRVVKKAAVMAQHYEPRDPNDWTPDQYWAEEVEEELGLWLLKVEALPYADHPDHRAEWALDVSVG